MKYWTVNYNVAHGLYPSEHPEDKELFIAVLLPALELFKGEISNLECIYSYRMLEQQECDNDTKNYDAYSSCYVHPQTGKAYYSIAISVETLKEGRDYAVMVFLHELAHVKMAQANGNISDHNENFENYLNMLILQYNKATNSHIKNDYSQYQPTYSA